MRWTVWFGASCMVASGPLSFALSWTASTRGVGRLAAEFDIACEEYRAAAAPVDTSRPANPGGARRSYGQAGRPTRGANDTAALTY
jgi:hypothetical protein